MSVLNTITTLTNEQYDRLKTFVTIIFPAGIVLATTIGEIWNVPNYQKIVLTLGAVGTFLGVILRASSKRYAKESPEPDPDDPNPLEG